MLNMKPKVTQLGRQNAQILGPAQSASVSGVLSCIFTNLLREDLHYARVGHLTNETPHFLTSSITCGSSAARFEIMPCLRAGVHSSCCCGST